MSSHSSQYATADRDQRVRTTVTVQPVLEPLSLIQIRKHLEIAQNDDAHDSQLVDLLQAAREQWETDTDSAVLTQTLQLKLHTLGLCIRLPKRPIQSVSSIAYFDGGNVTQTMTTTLYSLDAAERLIYPAYQQTWPATADRWDAVTVTYVAGYTAQYLVPSIAKQAMLLLIGYYFENRDMLANEIIYNRTAYEALVLRYMRSSYP